MSMLTKKQTKTFRADYINAQGKPETLIATVRHDDQCGNGHNTFSVTGEIYTTQRARGEPTIQHASGAALWLNGCGCIHDQIAKRLPGLAKYLKWHLCSTDGPLHYVANTCYLAGDRDHWGLHKGEFRQLRNNKTGLPSWQLDTDDIARHCDSETEPAPVVLRWKPSGHVGEGKERELDAARRAAIWPDATDAELTEPRLKGRLLARLPALLAEFRAAVEELGLTY